MNKETSRWIEAGKLLALDSQAQVPCPRCQEADLTVTDVSLPNDPQLIERHMSCPRCGAYNAIRLHSVPVR